MNLNEPILSRQAARFNYFDWVQESISVLGRLTVPVFVPLFAIHD